MQFSRFGEKFTGPSGVLTLMDDLGSALAAGAGKVLMLGGGNPAKIPAMEARFRQRMLDMLEEEDGFARMVGDYSAPEGHRSFIAALASLLRRTYGWEIGPEHIALTNGSQTSFFYLFNLFAGEFRNGSHKRILLPLAPEYIGYADVGLTDEHFVSYRPEISFLADRFFKYRIDFEALHIGPEIGAICVSRPTNPTGNVLTDEEIDRLSRLAKAHDIPLIIDNAYGAPFPHILYADARPVWEEHLILCMSLSKLGIPGPRTGIVIAHPRVVQAITALNAIISLAPGSVGAALALDMVQSGEVIRLSQEVIRPFYQAKAEQAVAWVREAMGDAPCYIHKPEGAFFLWLWFKDLPISSQTLYERLKARNVIVLSGHYFFPGLKEEWPHKQECLRVSYAQDDAIVHAGIQIIAEEVRRAYGLPGR
ncbi:MAG: valine--pyruvate transaminase [Caldilinea sp.]|nr:valine--pyruvate transaminase [Caldilinea sp.]MDW8440385.1 valine--pyruvate transaminase [Caldilineaceae bacterium]